MTSSFTKKDRKLRKNIVISPKEVGVATALVLQWTFIYVYFLFFPTIFTEGTDHHAVLNAVIVLGYQLLAYSPLLIFRGRVSDSVVVALPGFSLLVYELNVFSYLVYLIEFIRYGEVSFKYAQDRLVDKQNIITSFLAMLVMIGGVLCFLNRVSVARKIGLALASVMMLSLIVYHVNVYFFQFEPMLKSYEHYMERDLRQLSFAQNLKEECAKDRSLECYRFVDGEPWPKGAMVEGSKSVIGLFEDYQDGWVNLVKEKMEKSPDPRMIWTQTFRDSSFDETFAPQYSVMVVFTKFYEHNTIIIHRKMISYIFQISERMSFCILVLLGFWFLIGYFIVTSHPERREKIKINRYFWSWIALGVAGFFFEFQIYIHVMLMGLAAVLIYKRRWWVFSAGLFTYLLTYSHVGVSIVFMDDFVPDGLITSLSVVVSALMGAIILWVLYRSGAPKTFYWSSVVLSVISLLFIGLNPDLAKEMNPLIPIVFFGLSIVSFWLSKENLLMVFPSMFLVMAGIMTSVMTFWFVPGMHMDAILNDRVQNLENQINFPLATAYFIYGYFALLVGALCHYLIIKHEKIINKRQEK